MGKFICISVKSYNNVSHSERKSFIDAMYGDCYTQKKGFLYKFNNAIGFKNIVADITDFPTVYPAKVESPENYIAPELLFLKHMYIDLNEHGIVKFVLPIKEYKHFNSIYSYNSEYLSFKFSAFLQKVFPHLIITVSYLKQFNTTIKQRVLNFFFTCIDTRYSNITVECSTSRLLKNQELHEIEEILHSLVTYPFHIEQYFCETCKKYNVNYPYHTEIIYD